jgi:hypothetical protein
MEKRVLYLSARELKVTALPEKRDVAIQFDLAQQSAGLVPEFDFAIRLTAEEARNLARLLLGRADAAEGVTPP